VSAPVETPAVAGRGLRCAECAVEGRLPTIAAQDEPRLLLRPAFGWGAPPMTVLLCGLRRSEQAVTTRRERRT
jgi:hypothetical protein